MDGPQLCQRIRINRDVTSLAVGQPQDVPYVCSQIVTEIVLDKDNEEFPACAECAVEVRSEAEAAKLRGWGQTILGWSYEIQYRPELAAWLTDVASEINKAADQIEPGN
jgi:hypothetical protein